MRICMGHMCHSYIPVYRTCDKLHQMIHRCTYKKYIKSVSHLDKGFECRLEDFCSISMWKLSSSQYVGKLKKLLVCHSQVDLSKK